MRYVYLTFVKIICINFPFGWIVVIAVVFPLNRIFFFMRNKTNAIEKIHIKFYLEIHSTEFIRILMSHRLLSGFCVNCELVEMLMLSNDS